MKRIFAKGTLRDFWEKHPEVEQKLVFIRFIGSHEEYDKIDANSI